MLSLHWQTLVLQLSDFYQNTWILFLTTNTVSSFSLSEGLILFNFDMSARWPNLNNQSVYQLFFQVKMVLQEKTGYFSSNWDNHTRVSLPSPLPPQDNLYAVQVLLAHLPLGSNIIKKWVPRGWHLLKLVIYWLLKVFFASEEYNDYNRLLQNYQEFYPPLLLHH